KLSKTSLKSIKKEWKYIKGGQALIKRFLGAKYPERLQEIDAGIVTLEEWEEEFREYEDVAEELKDFAEELSISYTPLFQFRSTLFESLHIFDPHGLLLDQSEETDLDPIHLLRYYEFATQDEDIVVTSRVEIPYQISFRWRYFGSRQEFLNTQINKLIVLKNSNIERKMGDAIAPTPLLNQLETSLLPGVIICPISSAVAFYRL
ncbi:MAG: type I-D CRISPR-associated helicase Cas3', partial [Planktothrix sp.]